MGLELPSGDSMPQIIAKERAGHEVVEAPFATTVIEAGLHCTVTATIEGHRTARIDHAAPVLRSMMPAVRRPYSAGNAPVTRVSEEIRRGSRRLPEHADALR